ncbi:type II toxin-antitoxin system Phd/YefM family antitoxin [Aquabacterium sp. A7-Y]|uniref:type II toxin-antitoxin system Phd/YefM family antitoxin n=1 Tax=Aquabacterium sp. A7-Y TaxID=1349605 RepID=UPI00223D1E26|nr:type II toxin-antitoxin system Phd/YefM family antitoxin [Aquabacterium sp. A7-Y]MCW7539747.1 type II toxin-antitoxin system Phd/YefM family antitoxin [Aquabacterium sp. A7-Y]
MTTILTTLSTQEFNQDTGKAKKAANNGPVFITDDGRPAYVLLSIEHYQALLGSSASILDMLKMEGDDDIEFDPPRASKLYRPADFS